MFERLVPASLVRRRLAVCLDFLVSSAVWSAVGLELKGWWWLLIVFGLDVILIATWGSSPGRSICGIRVARVADRTAHRCDNPVH